VAQGSILGSLLFLVYINDVPLNIDEAKLVLYTDDTIILVVHNNEEILQAKIASVMKQLQLWFLKNDLTANTPKTAAMSFHLCQLKPSCKPCILLLNNEIDYKSKVKFLGMYTTENLSSRVHIRCVCHSLSKAY
jgi:hypothetical protein